MKNLLPVFVILFFSLLASCGSSDLPGSAWELVEIEDSDKTVTPESSYLLFGKDGKFDEVVYFFVQYADFKGTWEVKNDTLKTKHGSWDKGTSYLIVEKTDKTLKLKEIQDSSSFIKKEKKIKVYKRVSASKIKKYIN